jgi:hypothetical protein
MASADLTALETYLVELLARKKKLDDFAAELAKELNEFVQAELPAVLAGFEKDFNEKVTALEAEFGVVDGRYPAGVTIGHPVATEFERRYDALETEFRRVSEDAKDAFYTKVYSVYMNFPGMQEIWNRLNEIRAIIEELYEEARATSLNKLGVAKEEVEAAEAPFKHLFELCEQF